MIANHHPETEMLAAFAAGSLSLAMSMGVSAHLDYCSVCRHNVNRLKNLGGSLLESLTPAPTDGDRLKERVLARLGDTRTEAASPSVQSQGNIPRCLQRFVTGDYEDLKWQSKTAAIKSLPLCRDERNGVVSLLKIMPGGKVGHHGHLGEEVTLVLEGSFSDEAGVYRQGDFVLRDRGDQHNPIATRHAPCICLTIQDAPIQFTGVVARLLNPFLRASF